MTLRSARLRAVFLFLPLAGQLLGNAGAAQTWAPAGFGGAGYFHEVYFDPRQPGIVYLASDVAGVFRSTDAGDTWAFRSLGLGNLEVDSFAVDPFDSSHLWAGCGGFAEGNKSGIYTSTDSGLTWAQLPGSASAGISFRRFWNNDVLAPDPASKGTLLAGSQRGGVFRSTDGGLTFATVLAAPPTSAAATIEDPNDPRPSTPYPAPVAQVVFDPSGSGIVWAAFDGAGVYRSPERGTSGSWLSVSSGLPQDATVKALSFASGALYAAVGRAGVYRSTDAGASWSPANGDLPLSDPVLPWVSSVSADPADSKTALITLVTYIFRSVWKTTDGGTTWRAIDAVQNDPEHNPTRAWATWSTWAFSLARDPSRPARVFMTDYWSVQRSDDGGESWVEKVAGAQDTCVNSILVDAGSPAVLVGVWDAGILRSTDGGVTWAATRLEDGWVDNHSFRLVAAGASLFATFDPDDASYLLRSTDHGLTWTRVFSVPHPTGGGMMAGLAVDPSDPSTIYLSQEDGQIWKSTQRGDPGTFTVTAGQPTDNSFTQALAVDSQGRVFAGTRRGGGLFRSTDGGVSWTQTLSSEGTVNNVVVAGGAVWAAGGSSNLYRSGNGGATWQALTSFTPPPDGDGVADQGMAIAVDPDDARHILFSRVDTWHPLDGSPGIVESTDGGATWTEANQGLGLTRVMTLAFGAGGTVWAGTSCGGTWVRRPSNASCNPDPATLCLLNGRFRVTADYGDYSGNHGTGYAQALTSDTGYFWFASASNVEVVSKLVSFCGTGSNSVAVYAAGLTDLDVTLRVTDTRAGTTRQYHNPLGTGFSLIQDGPFGCPAGATLHLEDSIPKSAPDRIVETTTWAAPAAPNSTCVVDSMTLCLLNGRFQIRAAYRDYGGNAGTGQAVSLTSDTGYFWFFDSKNVEVVTKMVSFCGGGSKNVGIYSGGLTDIQVTLTVTDTSTGLTKTYTNPLGTPFQLIRDGPFSCP